jgi:hypothetical protein
MSSSLVFILVPDTGIADLPSKLLEHIFVFNSLREFKHVHNQLKQSVGQHPKSVDDGVQSPFAMGSHCRP